MDGRLTQHDRNLHLQNPEIQIFVRVNTKISVLAAWRDRPKAKGERPGNRIGGTTNSRAQFVVFRWPKQQDAEPRQPTLLVGVGKFLGALLRLIEVGRSRFNFVRIRLDWLCWNGWCFRWGLWLDPVRFAGWLCGHGELFLPSKFKWYQNIGLNQRPMNQLLAKFQGHSCNLKPARAFNRADRGCSP